MSLEGHAPGSGLTWRETFAEVRRRHPHLNRLALDFLERVLSLKFPAYLTEEQKRDWLIYVMHWQQFTGPIMAKGFEDSTLYDL